MVSAFSVPKAPRDNRIPSIPGPGAYNGEQTASRLRLNDPRFSFGRQSRTHSSILLPGPGAYNVPEISPNSPKYTIAKKQAEKKEKYNISPSQYQPAYEKIVGKSPSYSMQKKRQLVLDELPGPGQYNSKSFLQKNQGYNFSRQDRLRSPTSFSPGPCDYTYQQTSLKYKSRKQPIYTIGEHFSEKQNLNPGPGQYSPKQQTFSKIGGILSNHLNSQFSNKNIPGVGSYLINNPQNSPKWSISKTKQLQKLESYQTIGPAYYNNQSCIKVLQPTDPAYGFGKEKKMNLSLLRVPGPGQYSPVDNFSRRSIKIAHKKPVNYDNKVPGPGAYKVQAYEQKNWLQGKSKYTLGRQPKLYTKISEVPGPGEYRSSQLSRKKIRGTFGTQDKLKLPKNDRPGPASYLIKPTFADVPKYLLP